MSAFLSACATVDIDNRHLQPLPAELFALMSEKGMTQADPILIRIFKKESELEVWKKDRTGRYALLKIYPICRWSGQLGPKMRSRDRQAPEGFYTVTPELMNPRSQYHLAFNLGYPNPLERALGYTGDALMVHGACSSSGCYAMSDEGVAEVYGLAREAFRARQPAFQVHSLPFRMTPENLAAHRDDPNMPFWRNLKDGYDYFEVARQEPRVGACGRRYVFNARPIDPSARFDPAAPCPAYDIDSGAQWSMVMAKQERDEAEFTALVDSGAIPFAGPYLDGGMHSSFRELLTRVGPDRMAKLTSGNVEISRPDAALADPYASIAKR